jgi:hypothetical protein
MDVVDRLPLVSRRTTDIRADPELFAAAPGSGGIPGHNLQKEATMRWYHYLSYFFGGAFLANALPHLGNGISGHAFQSPFASPPGIGLSSSIVNVLWGLFNLAIGYLLVCRVGNFDLRKTLHVLVLGLGILLMSLMLAHHFGELHSGFRTSSSVRTSADNLLTMNWC